MLLFIEVRTMVVAVQCKLSNTAHLTARMLFICIDQELSPHELHSEAFRLSFEDGETKNGVI